MMFLKICRRNIIFFSSHFKALQTIVLKNTSQKIKINIDININYTD